MYQDPDLDVERFRRAIRGGSPHRVALERLGCGVRRVLAAIVCLAALGAMAAACAGLDVLAWRVARVGWGR